MTVDFWANTLAALGVRSISFISEMYPIHRANATQKSG